MIILKKHYKESTDMIHFYPAFSTEEELPDDSEIWIDGSMGLVFETKSNDPSITDGLNVDFGQPFDIPPGVSLEIYSDKGALEI